MDELRRKFDTMARVVDTECTELAEKQLEQPELEYCTEEGLIFKESADKTAVPIDPMRLRLMCRCALCT